MNNDDSPQGNKKRRISRACDYCHQRSKRCKASVSQSRCQNCVAFNQPCTFDRPQKRRGAPRRNNDSNNNGSILQRGDERNDPRLPDIHHVYQQPVEILNPPLQDTSTASREHSRTASVITSPQSSQRWQAPTRYPHATIMDLVELYFEIVYPIFPLFHQPSFVRRISRAEYTSDISLFSVTMAVCALVSARVRDGAVFNPRWELSALRQIEPEVYYTEASRQISGEGSRTDLNTLRTHAVLALAAIQEGKVRDMHAHLGRYHTVVATDGLHDESNWPSNIGIVETQERRRLFWSIYTLDIFTSIVWGGVIRSREYQSSVSYPSEVDDDMFDDTGFANSAFSSSMVSGSMDISQTRDESVSWMAGRNFVVDLYRVLEHIIMRLSVRKSRAQRKTLIDEVLQASDSLSQDAVLGSVMQMYSNLPRCLKETNSITSKPRLDRFGFQAADIIATIQLLRMILLSATGASIREKCQIANEVVNAFIAIPTEYHHAISVPLLFHLGVIGQILATTLEQQLSENDYRSIRDVMMAMVQLLSSLEGLHASKGASQRLKDQISRIDEYMKLQRHSSRAHHNRPSHVDPAPQILQRPHNETPAAAMGTSPASTFGSQAVDGTLDLSPFHLPSEILGDVSQIFDFSDLYWNMT